MTRCSNAAGKKYTFKHGKSVISFNQIACMQQGTLLGLCFTKQIGKSNYGSISQRRKRKERNINLQNSEIWKHNISANSWNSSFYEWKSNPSPTPESKGALSSIHPGSTVLELGNDGDCH